MEDKEPDYSFNQEIIDALKAGKTVWAKAEFNDWFQIDEYACSLHPLKTTYIWRWSLTKPKIKVKKKIERWANVFLNVKGEYNCFMHTTEKLALKQVENSDPGFITVPFEINFEVEE